MDIFYKAFTKILPSAARFIDARDATVAVAREYDQRTVLSVMQAWAAVGVGQVEGLNGLGSPSGGGEEIELLIAYPDLVIPDNDRKGITDTLYVEKDVRKLTFAINIKHPCREDLSVRVISPPPLSMEYRLHHKRGRCQDDLRATFRQKLRAGDQSVGKWTLKVVDLGKRDIGILKSWSITYE